jgi:drug/metabolite transporter (DMT)-like permease
MRHSLVYCTYLDVPIGMFLVVLLYAICALTFTVSKSTLLYAPPFFYMGVRMLCASGVLKLGQYLMGREQIRGVSLRALSRTTQRDILTFGIIGLGIAYALDIWSLQYMTSIESSLMYALSPFATACFAYALCNERLTPNKSIGMVLGIVGVLYLMSDGGATLPLCGSRVPWWAYLALWGAVFCAAYGWVVVKRILTREPRLSFVSVMIGGMLVGGVLLMALSFVTESWSLASVTAWKPFLAMTALIVLLSNILFSNLYAYCLTRYSATFVSFAGFICPFFAALFGWFFLNEVPDWSVLAGAAALLSLGLWVFHRDELSRSARES